MPLPTIKFDQSGQAAGVPGQAREDIATGTPVQITLGGGPFLAQLFTLNDAPEDDTIPAASSAGIVSPTAAVTMMLPIDNPGTYKVSVAVDSGQGLGAGVDDVATLTFYAGPTLSTVWDDTPQRVPAFGERTEHNAPDAIFPSGNPKGWARTLRKWFGVVTAAKRLADAAWGRVQLTSGGAVLVAGRNVSVARTSVGTVTVTFTVPLASTNYGVIVSPRGTGGQTAYDSELTTSFVIYRADVGGSLVDADFSFAVKLQ